MKCSRKVLIVCPAIGRPSETWLWRQVIGFRVLTPSVVCWAYENRETYPTDGITVHVLNHVARRMEGRSRWLIRLRNAPKRNFYGAVGQEKNDLRTVIETEQPCVLLCHFGHYALRLLPVAAASGIPVVVHFHGLDLSSALKGDRWYRWSLLHELPKFSAAIVVGMHQQNWLHDHGVPGDRIHLIPCGAPVSDYTVPTRPPNDRIRFITVSRLVAWKGVDLTLHAFARVAAHIAAVELLVVGDGPERDSLKSLAESLGVADRVIFAGACPPQRVRAFYESSDVFVQHSVTHSSGWVEGFGVSIVEASAAGLPVIVTRSGGIGPQVLDGRSGYLVEERDVAAMTDAMVRLAKDRDLRIDMGRIGRRHVEVHFDSQLQIQKLERVLLDIVERRGATRAAMEDSLWQPAKPF